MKSVEPFSDERWGVYEATAFEAVRDFQPRSQVLADVGVLTGIEPCDHTVFTFVNGGTQDARSFRLLGVPDLREIRLLLYMIIVGENEIIHNERKQFHLETNLERLDDGSIVEPQLYVVDVGKALVETFFIERIDSPRIAKPTTFRKLRITPDSRSL